MSNIVVVFPGIGYTSDKPLLYYALKLARKFGYDEVRTLTYNFSYKSDLKTDRETYKRACNRVVKFTEEELKGIDWMSYDKILFISKSLGTVAAASFEYDLTRFYNKEVSPFVLPPIKQIFFTPLEETFRYSVKNAIGFIGTSDPWSDLDKITKFANKQYIPITVYEKANHSLETGNMDLDLKNMADIMSVCKRFLES
ncbi:MAG: alpha/beta hydrolase [Lachnospiraceae bacterium]|nr:alpha/beta hydrolase [Lachnospiraceae bacterium]